MSPNRWLVTVETFSGSHQGTGQRATPDDTTGPPGSGRNDQDPRRGQRQRSWIFSEVFRRQHGSTFPIQAAIVPLVSISRPRFRRSSSGSGSRVRIPRGPSTGTPPRRRRRFERDPRLAAQVRRGDRDPARAPADDTPGPPSPRAPGSGSGTASAGSSPRSSRGSSCQARELLDIARPARPTRPRPGSRSPPRPAARRPRSARRVPEPLLGLVDERRVEPERRMLGPEPAGPSETPPLRKINDCRPDPSASQTPAHSLKAIEQVVGEGSRGSGSSQRVNHSRLTPGSSLSGAVSG